MLRAPVTDLRDVVVGFAAAHLRRLCADPSDRCYSFCLIFARAEPLLLSTNSDAERGERPGGGGPADAAEAGAAGATPPFCTPCTLMPTPSLWPHEVQKLALREQRVPHDGQNCDAPPGDVGPADGTEEAPHCSKPLPDPPRPFCCCCDACCCCCACGGDDVCCCA